MIDLVVGGAMGTSDSVQSFGLRLPGKAGNRKVNFWAENVAPRVAFGRPWAGKGGPKSHFFATNLEQFTKKSFQEGFQKKLEKMIGNKLKN